MSKMRAVQVPRVGGPLEMVEREIPEPGPGFVRNQSASLWHGLPAAIR